MRMILNDGKVLHAGDAVLDWLFRSGRWAWGLVATMWSLAEPLHVLIYCAITAIGIDFITGNIASYFTLIRAGERYRLNSDKMWKTGWKLALTITGSGFAYMLDTWVFPFSIGLAPIFASFILGAEFCSFLENASIITGWTGFVKSKKVLKDQFQTKTNIKLPDNENK